MPLTPVQVAAALRHLKGLVFLDSVDGPPGARSFVTAEPLRVLHGNIDRDWTLVARELQDHAGEPGGLYGWVGFDGEFVLGVYPHVLIYDHDTARWSENGELSSRLKPAASGASPVLDFRPQVPRGAFVQAVEQAQEFIKAGDIYQVNLAHPWVADWPAGADAFAFYENLRRVSPAPYAGFMELAGTCLLSSSPECFLHMRGREILTRPIKGTRPRIIHDRQQDKASETALAASSKEHAELLMITDLERNDLGRVCEYGSISVPELAVVERFAQVFHLVSTVTGTLRDGTGHAEAFRACFPGGSITGAPKKRALEIISGLEPHPRGIYTGAMGCLGFSGESQFNIIIRTAVQQGSRISFHVGAGIVADSVPELEYEETLHKAAGLLAAARAENTTPRVCGANTGC